MRIKILFTLIFLMGFNTSAQEAFIPNHVETDDTLRRIHVPILMYHYISNLPPNADNIRRELTVEPAIFRQHLEFFRDEGYQTISLADLHNALTQGQPLPEKPIILTFDDSYIDHYTNVFPMLKEFGFMGVFFVITSTADNNNPAHLSWDQITEMANTGMRMQAHTKNHAELDNRSYDFLVYEIMGSIESLEAYTGRKVEYLSYPVGRYDNFTLQIVQTMPINRAVTTQRGLIHTTSNYLEVPRLRVSGNMSVGGIRSIIQS